MTAVYARDFATHYDLFHEGKPYDAEAQFVDQLLRSEADGRSETMLDVACGTGQHAVQFADRGWSVLGVDQSEDMLEVARERAVGKSARFLAADMRELDLPESGFDAAVCLFDSIGYAVTNEAIARTLTGIRRHLRPGGLLVVEFWHAAAMLRGYEPLRTREWATSEGTIRQISRTALDVEHQVARVSYEVEATTANGRSEAWTEEHENRYFLVQEMDLFLRLAGFEPLRFLAAYDGMKAIDVDTWHIVCLARAPIGAPR